MQAVYKRSIIPIPVTGKRTGLLNYPISIAADDIYGMKTSSQSDVSYLHHSIKNASLKLLAEL